MNEIVDAARRLADEVLFPSAAATDAAGVVPLDHLDALAAAGFYGLGGPVSAGGLEADFPTVCTVVEILSGACLTTTFVWSQHIGAVLRVAGSETPGLRDEWLEPLCRGERRVGLAGPPAGLRARPDGDGWRFDGTAPWVSGWGRIDAVNAAARTEAGELVWALVDASALRTERRRLLAIDSSATVRASFDDVPVPAERVTAVSSDGPPEAYVLRVHAAYPLGVAARCCALLGPTPLDAQLDRCRAALDETIAEGDFEAVPAARAAASEVALRAAAALMVSSGSGAVVSGGHPERLAREALFLAVYGGRPDVRDAWLALLGVRP